MESAFDHLNIEAVSVCCKICKTIKQMCIDSSEKVIIDYEFSELSNIYVFQVVHASRVVGGSVVQWLARRSPDQTVSVGIYGPRT